MSAWITKLMLHPLFRFFLWLAITAWLIIIGVFNSGWLRWINFIAAIIAMGKVIENLAKTIAYIQKR